MQGAWAQFFFTGPGFLPDENGTNLDAPQGAKASPNLAAGTVVKDCAECPEMVVIPAGSIVMGSDANDEEKPLHTAAIRSFLLGKTEVTQKQWIEVIGSNPSLDTSCGQNCPVEGVTWNDIQNFLVRLNQKTGQKYRLPSEAEWEYAARAGTTTDWSFGNDESKLDSFAWYSQNSGHRTQPVGRKLPNAFGLFDMHGNVWEWTQDCWHENYAGAPSDGSAWTTGCTGNYRVLRGGSWYYDSADLRSSFRIWNFSDVRGNDFGFRLARDLSLPKAAVVATNAEQDRKQVETTLRAQAREEAANKLREEQKNREAIGKTEALEATYSPISAKISDKYAASIQAAIRPNITFTDAVVGNPAVEIYVKLAPDGTIISSAMFNPSGIKSWDTAALRALEKTERLPKDENGRVPPTLLLVLRPRER